MASAQTLEDKRLILHNILIKILDESKVHYQPDANIRLTYPCIIYMFDKPKSLYSNNQKYVTFDKFTITLITDDATDPLYDTLINLFTFENQFVLDGLYHTVLNTQF